MQEVGDNLSKSSQRVVAIKEAGSSSNQVGSFGTHAWPYEVNERIVQIGRDDTPRLRFVTDHFTPVGDTPRHGLLKALGGRSLCWAGHSLRFGPLDFKHWPIGYEEIAPYYSKAERLMGVYGDRDGVWNLPDGEFLKGVRMPCPEAALERGVERLKAQRRQNDLATNVARLFRSPSFYKLRFFSDATNSRVTFLPCCSASAKPAGVASLRSR